MKELSRVVGIFSGKGGVGKTTLVANLGSALTQVFNKNVVIFDNNVHTSHLGLHLGLYEDLPVTLREVLRKRVPIAQAVYIHPSTGIRIIPAPLNGDGLELTKEKCISLVNQVKNNYDMVILDCAPGLGSEVLAPMYSIDDAIVISTPDIASITDAMKTAELLKKLRKNVLGIVINRYRNEKYELTPQEISSTTGYNILAVVPEDSRIPEAISKGLPAVISYPGSKASRAFKQLAGTLINQPYSEEGLFDRLMGIFRRPARTAITPAATPIHPVAESRPRSRKSKQEISEEAEDVSDMKEELMSEIKAELKREIMSKVRKKLEGKLRGK